MGLSATAPSSPLAMSFATHARIYGSGAIKALKQENPLEVGSLLRGAGQEIRTLTAAIATGT